MPEQSRKPARSPLVSEFADDPEMADLVALFLQELPRRLESMAQLWRQRNFREMERLAHQLKGASAGYGFPAIGLAASKVENQLRAFNTDDPGRLAAVNGEIKDLVDLCQRALGESDAT